MSILQGRSVLEVGCGAGRFTELLLASGAKVVACDLSDAVEANFANCGHNNNYFVAQADVLHLPVATGSFDIVVCLGVIQHTPNSEETVSALAGYLKPGGLLVLDHYTYGYPATITRRILRSIFVKLSPRTALTLTTVLVRALLPVHQLLWRDGRWAARIRRILNLISPVVDYFEAYPELGRVHMREWAVLDTYDTLTDHYKHMRSLSEIRAALSASGLEDIEVSYGGNGVEARAKMPRHLPQIENPPGGQA